MSSAGRGMLVPTAWSKTERTRGRFWTTVSRGGRKCISARVASFCSSDMLERRGAREPKKCCEPRGLSLPPRWRQPVCHAAMGSLVFLCCSDTGETCSLSGSSRRNSRILDVASSLCIHPGAHAGPLPSLPPCALSSSGFCRREPARSRLIASSLLAMSSAVYLHRLSTIATRPRLSCLFSAAGTAIVWRRAQVA